MELAAIAGEQQVTAQNALDIRATQLLLRLRIGEQAAPAPPDRRRCNWRTRMRAGSNCESIDSRSSTWRRGAPGTSCKVSSKYSTEEPSHGKSTGSITVRQSRDLRRCGLRRRIVQNDLYGTVVNARPLPHQVHDLRRRFSRLLRRVGGQRRSRAVQAHGSAAHPKPATHSRSRVPDPLPRTSPSCAVLAT